MNRLLLVVTLVLSIAACKKIKEDAEEKAVMEFITDGQWRITRFNQGSIDRTGSFTAFRFQFKSNETIDALKNGAVEATGVWKGNRDNFTIYTNFNTTDPNLILLNATWALTGGDQNFVEAMTSFNSEIRRIRLEKP